MTNLVLDHMIFGNGWGLASPYFSARYYWLVDTSEERRDGDLYTFMEGFGVQLYSYQWTHPKPGETRRLIGREFRPFRTSRRWGRVEVAWFTKLPNSLEEANLELRRIRSDLNSSFIDDPIPWSQKIGSAKEPPL